MKGTWEWLGISPTTDKKAIKTAYANQVKKYHPEEYPEEAQELRKAYKEAMAQTKSDKGGKKASSGTTLASRIDSGFVVGRVPDKLTTDKPKTDKAGENKEQFAYRWEQTENIKRTEVSENKEQYQYTWDEKPKVMQAPPKKAEETPKQPVYTKTTGKRKPIDWTGENRIKGTFSYNLKEQDGLNESQKQRLDTFFKYYRIVYADSNLCRNVKAWRMIFKNFQVKEDYKNPDYVGAIIEELAKTNRIESKIWRLIERRLFKYANKDAEWLLLRDRFLVAKKGTSRQHIQAAYGNSIPAQYKKTQLVALIYKDDKAFVKKHQIMGALTDIGIICAVCAVFMVFALWLIIQGEKNRKPDNNKVVTGNGKYSTESRQDVLEYYDDKFLKSHGLTQSEKDKNNPEYKKLSLVGKQMVLTRRITYTEDHPYNYIDVNGDGTKDSIYYDTEEGKYKVSYYNKVTEIETYYLKDYKETNAEWAEEYESEIKYFIDENS